MRNLLIAIGVLLCGSAFAQEVPEKVDLAVAQEKGCLSCHEGIEKFTGGVMMETIEAMGPDLGDPAGCVVCHGGNPQGLTAEDAHKGTVQDLADAGGPHTFYPDPGALPIAEKACGQCHEGYTERLTKSLMNTEAGKLQGNLWSWGVIDGRRAVYGNYTLVDEDGKTPAVGTDKYKEYMTAYAEAHPDQLPDSMEQVPDVDVEAVSDHPNLAGITYSRQQCQRCHVGVTGREKRGDFRGAGCSSCHVPYSNDGFYEGSDPTIAKDQPGKLLTHQMQGSRKSKVNHNGLEYSGIPTESCVSCHNRGKRIGVSYQGIMEFPYGSPYDEKGGKQPKLHTKKYLYIKEDLHHAQESRPGNPEGGLLCQDCHTTIDMHGDGNLPGTTLAQVEVECEDCHGTVSQFPWELPLGYGEEFGVKAEGDARGLTDELTEEQYLAYEYEAQDGYLLTARGNPFGNVVKSGDKVIMHSASGLDFEIPVLKQIAKDGTWKSPNAEVAMMSVGKHMESMECYACHADWAPQCYGCHVTVDYSEGKTDVDWITNANNRGEDGLTPDAAMGTNGMTGPGKVSETRSYLRWEEPTLGINGEGRVSPLMPGCQVITTVIDKDGNTVAHNETWMTPDAGGTKGVEHAAVQPHTAGREARSCESCHNNPKALGYGISGGRFLNGYDKGFTVDLETAKGEMIPGKTSVQSQPIPSLDHDLSRIVTEDGKQLVSVGSHWDLTGPLPQEMREKMERTGLCMGCHQNMTDENLWDKVNSEKFVNNKEHQEVMDKAIHALSESKK
ncbi:multiheme c-type cytochrome [Roseibium sp.]|uniref:multiheme c-type cytochrome n=1 Tax=Roseibium sp. TaxID=1936156 RepID=UPI003B52627A